MEAPWLLERCDRVKLRHGGEQAGETNEEHHRQETALQGRRGVRRGEHLHPQIYAELRGSFPLFFQMIGSRVPDQHEFSV